jgi:hypothetical protein
MPKPSTEAAEYIQYEQDSYWHRQRSGVCATQLHDAERLLRAAQAEVERLHLVADHLGHFKVTVHNLYLGGSFAAPLHLLDHLDEQLSSIHDRITDMSTATAAALANLTDKLTALTTVGDGLATTLGTVHTALIDALANADAEIVPAVRAVADTIQAKTQEWSDALVANTDAADEGSAG